MIEAGMQAPEFTLPQDGGDPVTLSELRGKKVVLYFYPKDNTPGCTVQACDFRDAMPRLEGANTVVLGVSADPIESHAEFRRIFDLNFPLLADTDHAVSKAYGVWEPRKRFGVQFAGIQRSTFLIDEDGVVEQVWRKVKAEGHTAMLVDLLDA